MASLLFAPGICLLRKLDPESRERCLEIYIGLAPRVHPVTPRIPRLRDLDTEFKWKGVHPASLATMDERNSALAGEQKRRFLERLENQSALSEGQQGEAEGAAAKQVLLGGKD